MAHEAPPGARPGKLVRRLLGGALLAVLVTACADEVTTPGDCPTLCPGGQVTVQDTILGADPNRDSTFIGYTGRGLGVSYVATTAGTALPQAHGVLRFFPRPDSVGLTDTTSAAYVIDSVRITLGVGARDTLATNLRLLLYRIPDPLTLDTLVDFARIEAALVPENLLDSMPMPDSARAATLSLLYQGADLARVAIPAADSGTLALAVAVRADAPTAVRLPSLGTASPTFTTFVTADVADTTLQSQQLFRTPVLATWVQMPDTVPGPDLLSVGGTPSSRAIVRFTLPDLIRDSAEVSRADLELDLVSPILWIPGDSVTIEIRPVLVDLSAKSPTAPAGRAVARVSDGTSGTLVFDVSAQVRGWLGTNGFPAAFMVSLVPEASTLALASFGSTRLGSPPRLRMAYSLPFDFGSR